MASLTDLFNPTFLMFLGILVLVVALLVVYFETKFRDQNHKISSMLSLVSSLAEEVNGTKMVIHQLSMNQNVQMQQQTPFFRETILEENNQHKQTSDLIDVSDDDSDSDSDAGSEDSFSEEDSDSVDDSDSESDSLIEIGENNNDVKIFKLNISENDEDSESDDIDELSDTSSVASVDDLDDLDNLSDANLEELDDTSENVKDDGKNLDNFMDLKSINITLEETKSDQSLDYKKMALPKLRSVVSEKGLSKDSSKLKKNELLKLLGVE
jgi:hypothetical protein